MILLLALVAPIALTIRTADTSVTVQSDGSRLVLSSLRSIATGREWTAPTAVPLVSRCFWGSFDLPIRWRWVGTGDSRLTFESTNPKLRLTSEWTGSQGPGPVRHTLRIENLDALPVVLPLQPSLEFDAIGKGLQLWWVEKGGQWPSTVGTHRLSMESGLGTKLRSRPYSSDDEPRGAIPWMSVQDPKRNEGWYAGIEFSGRVSQTIQSRSESQFHVTMGTDSEGPMPYTTILDPKETFVAPPIFLGCYRGSVDDGSNRLRRWVERSIRPKVPDTRYPLVTLNSWGSGMAVDEGLAKSMIRDAVDLGVEMYHVDAGWYRSVGDWRDNPEKFPHGLRSIAEQVNRHGMRFGLWTGWTQGGADSGLSVRDPAMAGWFTHDYPSDWKPSDFTGADVCLGSREARRWASNTLERVVNDYGVDMLEHDQRMIVESCERRNHGHTSHPSDVAHHAALGYYSVQDFLRRRHPNLMFEDCVNGGHMVDYGVLRRVHYVSITDTYDPIANRRAFYDASYALPPSMCECYVADSPGPTIGTFKTMLRSGMMGWFTLMCDPASWSKEKRLAARRQIEIYKAWLRPLIRSGNLYHLTDRPDGRIWDAIQYFDPSTGKGVVMAFRGTEAPPVKYLRLQGLGNGKRYRVWFEGRPTERATVSGARLRQGLSVGISEPGASEIVYIEAIPGHVSREPLNRP